MFNFDNLRKLIEMFAQLHKCKLQCNFCVFNFEHLEA